MNFNITFFTIIYIVALIIPGVFFKRFYFQGAFNKQFGSGPFADRLLTSLFLGVVSQFLAYKILKDVLSLNFDDIWNRINTFLNNKIPDLSEAELVNSIWYFLGTVILSSILGSLCFWLVRYFKLDLYFKVFRFSNKWHYYFKGEILKTTDFRKKDSPLVKKVVKGALIDVLTSYGGNGTVLFTGNLTQYSLNKEEELETLYLTGVSRYKEIAETDIDGNIVGKKIIPKPIPGDIFAIPYSNVLNFNVQYIYEEKPYFRRLRYFIHKIIKFLLVMCFLIISFLPWFSTVEFSRKIFGLISLFSSWLWFVVIYSSSIKPYLLEIEQPKINRGVLIIAIILFIYSIGSVDFYLDYGYVKLIYNWILNYFN
ncbi:MAG: hypothetical protein WD607_06270 [Candidatus Paceibacterota bacterium]